MMPTIQLQTPYKNESCCSRRVQSAVNQLECYPQSLNVGHDYNNHCCSACKTKRDSGADARHILGLECPEFEKERVTCFADVLKDRKSTTIDKTTTDELVRVLFKNGCVGDFVKDAPVCGGWRSVDQGVSDQNLSFVLGRSVAVLLTYNKFTGITFNTRTADHPRTTHTLNQQRVAAPFKIFILPYVHTASGLFDKSRAGGVRERALQGSGHPGGSSAGGLVTYMITPN